MKELVFVTEARFTKGKNNVIYGDPSYNYSLWERYLMTFDRVYVLARIKKDENYESQDLQYISSGSNVEFIELPYYIGPLEYLKVFFDLKKRIKKAINRLYNCSFICRVPGNIGDLVIHELSKKHKKYAVEVVGDPEDVFAPGVLKHPLRAYFRRRSKAALVRNVKNSMAALYVTKRTLQEKYPTSNDTFNIFASDVRLEPTFLPEKEKLWKRKNTYEILSIGSLEQMYKAPDVVIKAINELNQKSNINFNLKWLGDGRYLREMNKMAKDYKVSEYIEFVGNVGKDLVYSFLQNADVFILVSRTEGLPRVIMEAMSVGLPIIGTRVGGIPELLEEKVLVEKNNPQELVNKILELINNEGFYNIQANRNFKESKLYLDEVLNNKRIEFYSYIINNQ